MGCGVVDWEAGGEVKDANWEKEAGAAAGTLDDTLPFALLFCVTDESNAGPGRSIMVGQLAVPLYGLIKKAEGDLLVLAPNPRAIPPPCP